MDLSTRVNFTTLLWQQFLSQLFDVRWLCIPLLGLRTSPHLTLLPGDEQHVLIPIAHAQPTSVFKEKTISRKTTFNFIRMFLFIQILKYNLFTTIFFSYKQGFKNFKQKLCYGIFNSHYNRLVFLRHFFNYNFKFLNRSEFAITDTELKLIATAAIMGDNKIPKTGYKTPAATGMPSVLYKKAKSKF